MDAEYEAANILADSVVNRIVVRQCVCLVRGITAPIFPLAWW
jgi:hypothetical protein